MSNHTSVFPVALLENAETRPIPYQGEEGGWRTKVKRVPHPLTFKGAGVDLVLSQRIPCATQFSTIRRFPVYQTSALSEFRPIFTGNVVDLLPRELLWRYARRITGLAEKTV